MSSRFRPAPLRRDPELPRVALVAGILGLVAGYAGFAIGASRGLDLIEARDLLGSGALIVVGAGVVVGLARLLMFQDWRPLVIVLALGLCLPVGHHASNLTLPGDTTDGTILIDLPPLPPWENLAVSFPGKCRWSDARSAVVAVESRRESVRYPALGQPRMRASLELHESGRGSMEILVFPPLGGEAVHRYAGTGDSQFETQDARVGRVVARAMARERVGSGQIDPEVAALLESTAPTIADASVAWTCPPWPRP